ncbi:hypothetical protein, partial [Pseudomonas sp. BAV 4579]
MFKGYYNRRSQLSRVKLWFLSAALDRLLLFSNVCYESKNSASERLLWVVDSPCRRNSVVKTLGRSR